MFDFQELNYDFDGDGILDAYAEETDLDGDGVAESMLLDADNDGIMDILLSDTDGDAYMETMALDTDGNGQLDQFYTEGDLNGDGVPNSFTMGHDYDQDTRLDSQTSYLDTNGDGVMDTVVLTYDSDLDGELDAMETHIDEDGDGVSDTVIAEMLVDTDGDGVNDAYMVAHSEDGGHEFEVVDIYEYDESTGYMEPLEYNEESVSSTALENFDPNTVDPEDVSGDPAESMEVWEFQGDTNRCAVYSQKFVIEEITGEDVDIEELADLAEANNWFSEEGGTPILDMNRILDHFGIENEMSFHNNADDLKECLDNGGKVIVAVDADEIWYGDDDTLFAPDEGVNHAVQVIGIDYSDPDAPMVILNDSGTPNGCGEMVPLEVFMDAWEDGNCQMISCM